MITFCGILNLKSSYVLSVFENRHHTKAMRVVLSYRGDGPVLTFHSGLLGTDGLIDLSGQAETDVQPGVLGRVGRFVAVAACCCAAA